jgi:hypothetical protein
VRCRLLRRYSSRAGAESAPLLPVFSDLPSRYPRGKINKRLSLSRKSQRHQLPRDVLVQSPTSGDTGNKEYFPDSYIDSLVHESTSSTALEDDPLSILSEIDDASLSAVTKSRIHRGHYSLFQRLRHLYMSYPNASIRYLVSYHDAFPDQQSSRSYNLLLRLALRHSAFGTAHALLQSMRTSGVPEDQTTWKLSARLLVREGRWSDAYNLVFNVSKTRSCAPFISDGVPITVWVELLGTLKRKAFQEPGPMRDPGMCTFPRYSHVMDQLQNLGVSSTDTPPPEVIYASVAALLQMQEREVARQVTAQFLRMDSKGLGMRLLHLHLAARSRKHSLKTFYRAIQDLRGFRVLCPELEPNSTTLSLLLGHLTRVKRCGSIGHKLIRWFRRRWGKSVVSPGVERRMLALAVKEKRVDLIKEWTTCVESRWKIWRLWSLEREVVDGAVPEPRRRSRRPDLRLARPGTERKLMNRLLPRAWRVLDVEQGSETIDWFT